MTRAKLTGKMIFLSASVPLIDRGFSRVEDAAFEIEQAVISLARSVFSNGGTIVFGGHPSISPLVALVAGEYQSSLRAESAGDRAPPSTVIFQSEAFREHATEANLLIFRLQSVAVKWVPKRPGEDGDLISGTAPFPNSVEDMRHAMISKSSPAAMVCIGGMEGVIDEVAIYRKYFPSRPIFVLRSTGGASEILAGKTGGQYSVIDDEIESDLKHRRAERHFRSDLEAEERRAARGDDRFKSPAVPYPLIMQNIVERVAG